MTINVNGYSWNSTGVIQYRNRIISLIGYNRLYNRLNDVTDALNLCDVHVSELQYNDHN